MANTFGEYQYSSISKPYGDGRSLQSRITVTKTSLQSDRLNISITGAMRLSLAELYGIQLTIDYVESGSSTTKETYKTAITSQNTNWHGPDTFTDYFMRADGYDRTITYRARAKGVPVNGYGGFGGSEVVASFTFIVPKKDAPAPNPPTNVKAAYNGSSSVTITWTNSPGSPGFAGTCIDRITNDGNTVTVVSNNGQNSGWLGTSVTSFIDNTVKTNSKYTYKLRHKNKLTNGTNSEYSTAAIVYTKPKAPSSVSTYKVDSIVNLSANISGANTATCEWQRSMTQDFASAEKLNITTATGQVTANDCTYYRVRTKSKQSSDGTFAYSSWVTCEISTRIDILINVPEGSTVKEINFKI